MEIVNLKIDQIKPYEKNPRMNDEAVDKVVESIKAFGFKVPIVVDKDFVIITGHTRYKASLKLGLNEIPCIIADDLTKQKVKQFRIADNRVGQEAKWDFALLKEELAGIDDLSALGFEDFELDFEDVDLEAFFEEKKEAVSPDHHEPKKIQCPHCGEYFEV